MEFQLHARFKQFHALRLKQFTLQRGVGLANQQFTAGANHAVPRNAFSRGCCCHRSACGSCAAR